MSEPALRTWEDVVPYVRHHLAAAIKQAEGGGLPVMSELADATGWKAGPINAMWGGPRPVANTLVGAGLGAILGYGGGAALEKIMPNTFEKRGPAKRLAVIGGMLGALPGAYHAYDNATQDKGVLDPWVGTQKAAAAPFDQFAPMINRDAFQNAIFSDPNTPPNIQAGAAGLVETASALRGGVLISPWDVTRIAIGGGSGIASGYLVGRAFGALAGLNRERQQQLQQAGMWAGVLKAVVPPALGFGR